MKDQEIDLATVECRVKHGFNEINLKKLGYERSAESADFFLFFHTKLKLGFEQLLRNLMM